MPIQYTSPYNLPYPQIGDPVKEGQANMELLAKRVNTVLTDGSFPASNPDVASITARLNALENAPVMTAEITADKAIGTSSTEFMWQWDVSAGDDMVNPAEKSQLIAPIDGWYAVDSTLVFSNVASGQRGIRFKVNYFTGPVKYRGSNIHTPEATYFVEVTGSLTTYLKAGEFVQIFAEVSNAAASVSLKAGLSERTRVSMRYLRP